MNRYQRVGDIPDDEMAEMLFDENLIPSFNRSKQRFKSFLRLIMDPLEDIHDVFKKIYEYFDVSNAVGKQLDAIGEIVGVGRELDFVPESTGKRTLDDDDYRILIRAGIAKCSWDGTMKNLQKVCSIVFQDWGVQIVDNQNCTIKYILSTSKSLTDLQREMMSSGIILPSPAGVSVTVESTDITTGDTIVIQVGVYDYQKSTIVASAE